MKIARSFASNLAWRVAMLALACMAAAFFAWHGRTQWGLAALAFALGIGVAINIYHYVNDTNRRLARLFESVRYSDFAIRFSGSVEKGASFAEVNRQFNEVLEAFRQTRAEKEANLLFLNAIVQHLSTGLLAFSAEMQVLISNSAAFQLLGVYRLNHLEDLPLAHQPLAVFVRQLSGRNKLLYQPDAMRQLAVQGVRLNLQGRSVCLITLQNIHPELQRKEVDAWRDLTRVLRHEMMNSITPIVSLVETMQQIVRSDLPPGVAADDLTEALEVVATRSRGLMNFVDAYRSFTAIPAPRLETVAVKKILERVLSLAAVDLKSADIQTSCVVQPEDLSLHADAAQLEMTLINLLKNAREALMQPEVRKARAAAGEALRITLRAGTDTRGKTLIEVEDNGPGIPAEMLDEIFIPFFTSKPEGTGVGLSISRQIMQQHGGDLRVSSEPGRGARFVLEF